MAFENIKIQSYAKLNLFLKVLDRRADGYHDIHSVFQTVELADELIFRMEKGRTGINLRCTDPYIPIGNDNLIVKAYNELAAIKEPADSTGIVCELTKNIPVCAGLGGGSSNCAAALIVLNKLLDINLEIRELAEIGAGLGSDVPFFFAGGTCFVHGRGENIEILPQIDKGGFLILKPQIEINTAEAYGLIDDYREKYDYSMGGMSSMEAFEFLSDAILNNNLESFLINDFEKPVFEKYPEISEIKSRLTSLSPSTLMTGSGSSVFAYFKDYDRTWESLENFQPIGDERLIITRPVGKGFALYE